MATGPVWTLEQQAVIEASAAAKLIVDAGPGTGKTATLCARIAWLIQIAVLEPGEIWIISFTRTAVAEIRNRVSSYLADPTVAQGIRVATIDSHAWAMNVGFTEVPVLSGNFDDNIKHVIELIKSDEHASEYINSVRHLFIDESQDVIGPRVEFVLELIYALPEAAGVTVLCDEAQAIYEYAEAEKHEVLSGTLIDNIRKYMPEFEGKTLNEIHRTDDAKLRQLFTQGRGAIKNAALEGKSKYHEVRRIILECNHDKVGEAEESLPELELDDDVFLLFRRRGEALSASKLLGERPHRLRMSGLPHVVDDWVGLVFWDWPENKISQENFYERWAKRVPIGIISKESAWHRLVRIAGKNEFVVDLHKLRRRLSSISPPLELCRPDFGTRGPIVGTVHAAKGREAGEVRLYLPRLETLKQLSADDFESESKTLFVGATRARERLLVGRSFWSYSSRLGLSGRAYTRCASPWWAAEVEIGRAGDIGAEGLVGRQFFGSMESVKQAQASIAQLRRGVHYARARASGPELDNAYLVALKSSPGVPLLALSGALNRDLIGIARNLGKWRSPLEIGELRTLGVRTLAISPDDPVCASLHRPWSDSGFILAPLLVGYGALAFR